MRQSAETELSTQKTLQGKIASKTIHSFQTFSIHSLRGRHKKGRGRGEEEKRQGEKGRERRLLPLSPIPLPFFPSSLSPTPFDICYAGHNIHRVRYFRRLWKSRADFFQNRFII